MKFVKGDAIASIIIVIVNLLGGLTIGVLQRGLPAGEAMQLYSILTIGDGMVAQIPALLSAMAAGLVVTRSASDGNDSHLGDTIGRQISAHPRALMMTSVISALLALVPGFPTLVFLGIAVVAFVLARRAQARAGKDDPHSTARIRNSDRLPSSFARVRKMNRHRLRSRWSWRSAHQPSPSTSRRCAVISPTPQRSPPTMLGIRLPQPALIVSHDAAAPGWRISIFDVPVASSAPSEPFKADAVCKALEQVLSQQAERFVGVQEVSDLLDAAAEQYPALVKEVLRQISAQKVAEVLRLLLRESIPLRNLRDVLEALAEWGSEERDAAGLAEFVRIGLKRYMTSRYADANRHIAALVIDASVEDAIRRALTDTPAGVLLMLPPKRVAELRDGLGHQLARLEPSMPLTPSWSRMSMCDVTSARHSKRSARPSPCSRIRSWLPMSKFSRSARCGSIRRNAMQPRNSLLVALVLMCAASTLSPTLAMAAEPTWPERSLSLEAQDQPLADFLRELFRSAGLNAQPSDGLSGRISGRFDDSPERIFADVVKAYDLVPYYDGAVMHVANASEVQSKSIRTRPDEIERVARKLATRKPDDPHQSIEISREDGVVKLRGTPAFVRDMEQLIAAQSAPERASRRTQSQPAAPQALTFRTFPLKYASAADQTFYQNGQEVKVPGVVTHLALDDRHQRLARCRNTLARTTCGSKRTVGAWQGSASLRSR